ncbi:MAG: hypothetical protein DDT20_00223 [Firmicutes bacterium]|nr:hypothetical protein [Bacillota bacterium]
MRQVGEVMAVYGSTATVKVRKHSACAECRHKCVMGHETKEVAVTADNRAQAEVGDTVSLELSDRQVLQAAFLIYIVPVLFLFAGVGLSMWFGLTETQALLFGLLGLVSAFVLLKFVVDPYIRRQAGYRLIIVCTTTDDKES